VRLIVRVILFRFLSPIELWSERVALEALIYYSSYNRAPEIFPKQRINNFILLNTQITNIRIGISPLFPALSRHGRRVRGLNGYPTCVCVYRVRAVSRTPERPVRSFLVHIRSSPPKFYSRKCVYYSTLNRSNLEEKRTYIPVQIEFPRFL